MDLLPVWTCQEIRCCHAPIELDLVGKKSPDYICRWLTSHVGYSFHADLQSLTHQIQILFDALEAVGMKINFNKSVMLVRLTGSQAHSIKKCFFYKADSKLWFRVPRHDKPDIYLPMVASHTYLGAKNSLSCFWRSDTSIQIEHWPYYLSPIAPLAVAKAHLSLNASYSIMVNLCSKFLHSWVKRCGSHLDRCYSPSSTFFADLRRIARSPSHLTHESTSDLLNRLRMDFPLVHLKALWTSAHERRCTSGKTWTRMTSFVRSTCNNTMNVIWKPLISPCHMQIKLTSNYAHTLPLALSFTHAAILSPCWSSFSPVEVFMWLEIRSINLFRVSMHFFILWDACRIFGLWYHSVLLQDHRKTCKVVR